MDYSISAMSVSMASSRPLSALFASVATVFIAVAAAVAVAIAPFVTALKSSTAMAFLIARNIFALVPAIGHKIDRLATGAVLAAIAPPMLGVPWRNPQIEGRATRGGGNHRDRL